MAISNPCRTVLFLFPLALIIAFSPIAWGQAADSGWVVDSGLKMHLGYFVEPEPVIPEAQAATMPVIALTPESKEFEPDITNISLSGIRGLGFPLPDRPHPETFTFFLKFFAYPQFLSAAGSFEKIFERFLLSKMTELPVLKEFAGKPGNVVVKMGNIAPATTVFTAQKPYPPFRLPKTPFKTPAGEASPQDFFDSNIPFSSIYLTPAANEPADLSADDRAKWSANGVLSFHKQLVAVYEQNLKELKVADPQKTRCFQVPLPGERGKDPTVFASLELLQTPFVFGNFRDLPMPHDPKKIFLSGLLLVHYSEFKGPAGTTPENLVIHSPEFEKQFKAEKAYVLEIGSVVRF